MSTGVPTGGIGTGNDPQEPGNIFEQYDAIMKTVVTGPDAGFEPPVFESEPVIGGFIPHLPTLSPSMINANGKVDMIIQDGYVVNASVNTDGEWTFAHNFNYFHSELPVEQSAFSTDQIENVIFPKGLQAPVPSFVYGADYLPLMRAAAVYDYNVSDWLILHSEARMVPRRVPVPTGSSHPAYLQEYMRLPDSPSRIKDMLAAPPAANHPGMGGGAGGN